MDKKITDVLFEGITTLAEAYQLDEELRVARDACFSVKADKKGIAPTIADRVKNQVSDRTYRVISVLEEKKLLNLEDPDATNRFFETAHNEIITTPKLQLQIAIELNSQVLLSIKNWVTQEIQRRVFLDIIQKPQILAGCVIVFQGAFRDFSIRKKLEADRVQIFKPILDGIVKSEQEAITAGKSS